MAADVFKAIATLWKKSPIWRFSLGGLMVFSALTYIAGGFSPPSPQGGYYPPPPPAPMSDPASDQRLSSLLSAFTKLANEQRPGYRCEQLAQLGHSLTGNDSLRVSKQMSPAAVSAKPALTAADWCSAEIAASDSRFDNLALNVGKSDVSHSPAAIVQAAQAFSAITGFDQSRDRYITDAALITKGKALHSDVIESGRRIDALLDAGRKLVANPLPDSYRLFATLDHLTDLDRYRLTPDQQQILDALADARKAIATSKMRLARVSTLMSSSTPTSDAQIPALIEATTAISPLDEALATPDLRSSVLKARAIVQQRVWLLLAEKLKTIKPGQDANVDAEVARLYSVVKGSTTMTPAQRELLDRAAKCASSLSDSDDRLQALSAAAHLWNSRGDSPVLGVDQALAAITPYDEKRFQEADRQAFATLNSALIVLRGPDVGLTQANMSVVPIAVTSSRGGDQNERFVNRLKKQLANDFHVVEMERDAAILIDIDVKGFEQPRSGSDGPYAVDLITAHIGLRAVWTADQSPLIAATTLNVDGSARSSDDPRASALLNGINNIETLLVTKARQHH